MGGVVDGDLAVVDVVARNRILGWDATAHIAAVGHQLLQLLFDELAYPQVSAHRKTIMLMLELVLTRDVPVANLLREDAKGVRELCSKTARTCDLLSVAI